MMLIIFVFFPQLVLAFTSAFTFYYIGFYCALLRFHGLLVKSSKTKQLRMLSYSDSWSCCDCLGLVVDIIFCCCISWIHYAVVV